MQCRRPSHNVNTTANTPTITPRSSNNKRETGHAIRQSSSKTGNYEGLVDDHINVDGRAVRQRLPFP
eukprot:12913275-Prorocentrum_lima.AAC.1